MSSVTASASASSAAVVSSAAEPAFPQLRCRVSPSLLPNNLISNSNYISYIHRNEVHLIENKQSILLGDRTDGLKCLYAEKESISSIAFTHFNSLGSVLVLASTAGLIQIYDETGQKLHCFHKLQKSQVALSARDSHLRGLISDGAELLFCGSGSGELFIFHCSNNGKKLELKRKLETGGDSIWDVAYFNAGGGNGILAAGDENGGIFVWKINSHDGPEAEPKKLFEHRATGNAQNHPLTSLAIGYGFICAAYTSGHIRLFSIEKKSLAVEIAAHSRTIMSIELHATEPILIAASEDTFFSAWQLPTEKKPLVVNRLMESQSAALLTGVQFVGPNSSLIATSVYDSKLMNLFPAPPNWD